MKKNGQIYNRADIVNFMKVQETEEKYNRMIGFTEGGKTLNSSTYDRRYIDEETERSDVISYAPEIGYAFDRMVGNEVHEVISEVHENEIVGKTVEIVTVNFNKKGETDGTFEAKKRTFSVVPDADGDGTEAYTYSGTFKANGKAEKGIATTDDDWKTATFEKVEEAQ